LDLELDVSVDDELALGVGRGVSTPDETKA